LIYSNSEIEARWCNSGGGETKGEIVAAVGGQVHRIKCKILFNLVDDETLFFLKKKKKKKIEEEENPQKQ